MRGRVSCSWYAMSRTSVQPYAPDGQAHGVSAALEFGVARR